ncbi:unnamed protein product [Urochloa humidicola]
MQTLVRVLGMVNHQDQSGMETEILGAGVMIEKQKIGTDTGMVSHLRDQEVRGRGTITDILKEEKKDQKDVNMMTWIASGLGMTIRVTAMKEEADRCLYLTFCTM